MSTTTKKKSLFVTADGRNLTFTFLLVSSLFLLWGFCNGMIDVMDKHFQEELHLTLAQSANVQWAHYLGYFLMSIPAGWLASKLGYKGGIIAGLLMVAVGGLWFIPASHIAQFWAFLVGVCFIASGLTFLETIANPYTTVLGPQQYAATRINLAQSCNGVGWIFGPIVGGMFFYSKNEAGQSTGSETLWIPYAAIAGVVTLLAIVFYLADVPDIKAEDDYHIDDDQAGASRSIWSHAHFVMAIAAQFLYVAAQAGIFSFFINYMTSQVPNIPSSWRTQSTNEWIETNTTIAKGDIKDLPKFVDSLKQKSDPISAFIASKLSEDSQKAITSLGSKDGYDDYTVARVALAQDLNSIVKQDPFKAKKGELLCDQEAFKSMKLSETTKRLLTRKATEDATPKTAATTAEKKPEKVDLRILNRHLLHDAYPEILPFDASINCISDKGASILASLGFIFFLVGRFTGAGLLKKFSAHKVLGLYGLLNVVVCYLVFAKYGWLSVVCVFLSYFFMSIMFPTIFALGIFGLGSRAKKASAFIVMAIMGGAVLPKLMGHIADQYDMSRAFIVPLACFAFVALYGFIWPKLSKAESLNGLSTTAGH